MGTSVEQTTAAQMGTQGTRTRTRRSMQEKLQIVQETLSDVSVAVVARRHGVNANQVFAWRRQYQRGELGARAGARAAEAAIVPVRVAVAPQARGPSSAIETGALTSGSPRIDIELAEGMRLKVWDISSETVRAIIRDLMRPC